MSYHLEPIPKGVFGEVSKIEEELLELKDAIKQENKIMIGCELSDLYGAVREYAKKHSLSMRDLEIMADATKRAFDTGYRGDSPVFTEEIPYYKQTRAYSYNNTTVCAMITQQNTLDIMVSMSCADVGVMRCDIMKIKAPTITNIKGSLTVDNPTRPNGRCVIAKGTGIIVQNDNYFTVYEYVKHKGTICFINVEDHVFCKEMNITEFNVSKLAWFERDAIKAVERLSRDYTK